MDEIARLIDARGIAAPLPLLDLRRALDEVVAGELVELVSDDQAMGGDIDLFVAASGHALEAREEEEDGAVRFRLRKL